MSNMLPPNASLAWLKKQAKRRRKSLQTDGVVLQLAEVQFQFAKDYGFSSWRSLKAHVDQRDGRRSNQEDEDSIAVFLRHVGEGNLQDVSEALARKPEIVNAVGAHPFWGGRPQALHVCIENNRTDVFDLLVDARADVNGSNAEYDFWSPLMLALFNDRTVMIETLSGQGAQTGLCEALLVGDDQMLDVFSRSEDVLDYPRPSGSIIGLARTPYAVNRLIEIGFDTQGKNRWGSDAMDALSRLGKKGAPLVEALGTHETQITAKDLARIGDLDRLRSLAQKDGTVFADEAVLMAAVDFGEIEVAAWLMKHGANVNARHDFWSKGTALHSAAWNGDVAMVDFLVDQGADKEAVDEEYRTTPLVWAQTSVVVTNNPRCKDVVDLLRKRGAM